MVLSPTLAASDKHVPTMIRHPKEPPETQSDHSGNVRVIAFCLLLVVTGMILGYVIFSVIYQEACAALLLERERSYNSSQINLRDKYNKALADVRQCEESSHAKEELQQLQGRLQAQALLSNKHQDLLERHERTLDRISELQKTNEVSQGRIHSLKEFLKSVKSDMEECSLQLEEAEKKRNLIQRNLDVRMEQTTNTLNERAQENARIGAELASCGKNIELVEGKLADLKNLVQQQNFAAVTAMFGEGPYIIRFNLEFPSEPVEPNYFEIKIRNPRDMPHTVLTFLNMIDNGLYVDTTFDFARDQLIKGGSPHTIEHNNVKSMVLRRFANFGYSAHNTLFFEHETSPNTPCKQYGFGLDDRGPHFNIYLADVEESENPYNCVGVITKGRGTLARLINSHTDENGELTWKVPIVATYLVALEDEL